MWAIVLFEGSQLFGWGEPGWQRKQSAPEKPPVKSVPWQIWQETNPELPGAFLADAPCWAGEGQFSTGSWWHSDVRQETPEMPPLRSSLWHGVHSLAAKTAVAGCVDAHPAGCPPASLSKMASRVPDEQPPKAKAKSIRDMRMKGCRPCFFTAIYVSFLARNIECRRKRPAAPSGFPFIHAGRSPAFLSAYLNVPLAYRVSQIKYKQDTCHNKKTLFSIRFSGFPPFDRGKIFPHQRRSFPRLITIFILGF